MKALVFNGKRDIRYESFDDPKMERPNGAILKVTSCSICGSDLHMYHGENIGGQDYGGTIEKFCTGHEFIGEVVEVGPDTHTFKVGDKVLSGGGTGCGHCDICRKGRTLECRRLTAFGISPDLQGGQAEYVFVPNADGTLLRCDGFTDEQALLMTDAMATAQFGINRCDIAPDDIVIISGLGPIGLIAIELAYLQGASVVYAIDPVETRRDHAANLGAIALTPGREASSRLKNDTKGEGADCLFEASGASSAIKAAPKFMRIGGTISMIGLPQPGTAIDMQQILFRNITLRAGVARVQEEWDQLRSLIRSGRLKANGLFTHHYDLSEGAEAYRAFDGREAGVIKMKINVG